MKILIVIPKIENTESANAFIPIGTAYLNAVLRDAGKQVIGCNLNHEDRSALMEKSMLADIIMVGGVVNDWKKIINIFQIAKLANNKIITIGGGAGYTASPILFSQLTGVDYAMIGEGEATVCELIDAIESHSDVANVKGIVYKQNNHYTFTGDRQLVHDLDRIPFPNYDGLCIEQHFQSQRHTRRLKTENKNYFLLRYDEGEEVRELPMLLSRSCPFRCKFCFHTVGNTYRIRSMDNFFRELDMLIDRYHINGIQLIDELFGMQEDVIAEFCNRIKKYNITWFAEIRVETAGREVLQMMKDAGCANVQFGIENINDDVLKNMNKNIQRSQIELALQGAYDAGMTVSGNILLGAENDRFDIFLDNFDWCNRHRQYIIHLVSIAQYTGSQYYKNCLKRGLIKDEKRYITCGVPSINMSQMSDYEWQKMKRMIMLYRIDKAFEGEIYSVDYGVDDVVEIEAECAHCKQKYLITTSQTSWNNEKISSAYCTNCGRRNIFDKVDHKRDFEYCLMSQWLSNENYGIRVEEWLIANDISTVGIIWNSSLGQLLYERLMNCADIEVLFVVDDYGNLDIFYPEQNIVSLNDVSNYQIDALLVCESAEFVYHRKSIRKNGYSGVILSSADIIFGHHFFAPDMEDDNE